MGRLAFGHYDRAVFSPLAFRSAQDVGGLVVWIIGTEGQAVWGDDRVWGTAFAILAIAITMVQSYGALEKVQTLVVSVLLLSILTAAAAARSRTGWPSLWA